MQAEHGARDTSDQIPHATTQEWREAMSEAVAKAETEGVMEEYEDDGNAP